MAHARLSPRRAGVASATLCLFIGLLGCSSPGTPGPATAVSAAADPGPEVPVRLIALNDFHGHLEPGTLRLDLPDTAHPGQTLRVPVGGAAALAGLLNELRAGAPHSLLLSAGDLIGGTPLVSSLFRHESTLAVARQMQVDVAVVGNHEFDAGWDELQRLMRGGCAAPVANVAASPAQSCADAPYPALPFPLLGANVRWADDGSPALAAYAVRQIDGVKLGVIGAVTRSTPDIVLRRGIAALRFDDEVQAINAASRALREQGVHAQVLLIHEGGELAPGADWNDEHCPGARGPVFDIAQRLDPAVQLIFSAHSHQGYRCRLSGPDGERRVMQATAFGRGLAVADVRLDRRSGTLMPALTRTRNLPVLNAGTPAEVRAQVLAQEPAPWRFALQLAQPDPAIAALVARYVQRAAPLTDQPVGRLAVPVVRGPEGPGGRTQPRTDTPAGRWLADAHLAATRAPEAGGAELALMNSGGIRSDLDCAPAPCTVRYGQVITQQPFGNALVTLTLTGEQLRRLLESQQRPDRPQPAFLQPSAGLRYTWVASAPDGAHVQDLLLNGRAVQPQQRIRVVANGFLADGGDGYTVLRDGVDRHTGPLDAEAVLQRLQPSLTGAPDPGPDPQPRIRWQP